MILIIITTNNINLCLWCESTTYCYIIYGAIFHL